MRAKEGGPTVNSNGYERRRRIRLAVANELRLWHLRLNLVVVPRPSDCSEDTYGSDRQSMPYHGVKGQGVESRGSFTGLPVQKPPILTFCK